MARAIIRFSLQGGPATVGPRQQVQAALEAAGFERVGTSSYEAVGPDQTPIVDGLRQALDILEGTAYAAPLDHLWIYLDNPENRP